MKKKYIGFIIFLTLFLTPLGFTLAQTSNAGFIPGNIWYSKDPFEEGDKIKIYTLIYNSDSRQLSGTVFFFDKTTFLGNKTFTIPGKGLQDVSIEWTVGAGDHTIFGQIQNAKFLTSDNTYIDVSLSEVKTSESKRSVSKKITLNTTTDNTNSNNETSTTNSGVIANVQNVIKENTPSIVSDTIDNATNVASATTSIIENFRNDIGKVTNDKKEEIKKEIKNLETKKTTSIPTSTKNAKIISKSNESTTTDQGAFLKPFKYTELFALSLFSTVFNNKYIFYGLIAIVIFFILRLVVRKLF